MTHISELRNPSEIEEKLLLSLTDVDFPGRDNLRLALSKVRVRTIDEDGSLELITQSAAISETMKQIPVEAEAVDDDGIIIHVLLHVRKGRPVELEIFKEDGSPIRSIQSFKALRVFVLPPHPSQKV